MDWIIDLFNKLLVFLYQCLLSLIEMLKDVVIWALTGCLEAAKLLLKGALSMLEPVDMSQYLSDIPSGVAWTLGQIGIPQCLGIILTAIVIRLILQLIPFTRLGS